MTTPAEGIGKLGFRRWYERELIEAHVALVTCLLCMMLVAVCVEQIDRHGSVMKLAIMVALIPVGTLLCVRSVIRYHSLLFRAERLGEQSNCGGCQTYGILEVLSASRAVQAGALKAVPGDNSWIRVRCRRCGHEWRMDND